MVDHFQKIIKIQTLIRVQGLVYSPIFRPPFINGRPQDTDSVFWKKKKALVPVFGAIFPLFSFFITIFLKKKFQVINVQCLIGCIGRAKIAKNNKRIYMFIRKWRVNKNLNFNFFFKFLGESCLQFLILVQTMKNCFKTRGTLDSKVNKRK